MHARAPTCTHAHEHARVHTHTHIRQTDNCYTYECKKICLALTEVFKITGIYVLGGNNNEPNHGGFLADQSGSSHIYIIILYNHARI